MISTWHKIDLHIHTDKSNITKDNDYKASFDSNILINKLKKNSVAMISLTDHNIINCAAYKDIDNSEIKILVGVELDISISEEILKKYVFSRDSGDSVSNKPFHIIVIFRSRNYSELNMVLDKMYESISINELESKINLNRKKKLRTTTFKYLFESFQNEDFFIIAHGNKHKGIVSPYKLNGKIYEAQYNILIGEISALEMKSNIKRNNAINIYNEGFKKLLERGFEDETTSYVSFSDNHDCNNYKCPKESTWLKGHLNYESLRIGFSDPESRICSSEIIPTHVPHFIEKIKIHQTDGSESEIQMSPYLNVIIGGRSSGKSLFFNTIVALNQDIDKEQKVVFERDYKNLIDLNITNIKLNIGDYSTKYTLNSDAYYQEKIIELFNDEKDLRRNLDEFFLDFSDQEISIEETKIGMLFNRLKSYYKIYYETQNVINKGNRSNLIINSAKDIKEIIHIDENDLHVEFNIDHHIEISDSISGVEASIKKLKKKEFKGKSLFNFDEQDKIDDILSLLKEKKELIDKSKNKTELIIDFFKKIKNIYREFIQDELSNEAQTIAFSKNEIEEDLRNYKRYFLSKLKLKEICKDISNIEIKVEDKIKKTKNYNFCSKLNFEINNKKITEQLFQNNFINYNKDKNIYKNIIDIADSETEVRVKQKTGLKGKTPDIFDKKVDEFVLKNKSKKEYEIVEKGDMLVNTTSTSQGRKASIFLDVKLNSYLQNNEKKVLMIDQIEDNIDNKYISETLVTLIRKLKKKMQIILVTHNPSIAIYGDAENIIICENTKTGINYRQGGLENKVIRKEACNILDGGDVAFRNRMSKYNIEKLKSTF
ncbi:MAG: hypothetical protein GY714_08580 [Desulfobacterales bacterium]|nr:hypothetical protein [Desulfobacterales bacterium]